MLDAQPGEAHGWIWSLSPLDYWENGSPQAEVRLPSLNSQQHSLKRKIPLPSCQPWATTCSPGHKHSGVHRRHVVLPSWNLIIAKVPRTSIFLVLPVTETLQGPLPMVPNGQLGLKEVEVGSQRSQHRKKPEPVQTMWRILRWSQLLTEIVFDGSLSTD
jgi:hypothetical protein